MFHKLVAKETQRKLAKLRSAYILLPNPSETIFVPSKELHKGFPQITKRIQKELGIKNHGIFLELDIQVYLAVQQYPLLDTLDKQRFAEYFQQKQSLHYFHRTMQQFDLASQYMVSMVGNGVLVGANDVVLLLSGQKKLKLSPERRVALELSPGLYLNIKAKEVTNPLALKNLQSIYFAIQMVFVFIQNNYKGMLLPMHEKEVSSGRHDIRNIHGGQEIIEMLTKKKLMALYQQIENVQIKDELEGILDNLQQISHGRIGVNNILNALPGEKRSSEERPRELHLKNFIEHALFPHIRMLLKGQDIKLVESINDAIPEDAVINIPISLLLSAIDNLLINSLEALANKAEAKEVTLAIIVENDLKIVIRDNGSGIYPETLAKIKRGLNVSTKGSGLGLRSVANVVARCGGTFDIDSIMGVGTTMTIGLPYRVAPKQATHHEILVNTPERRELYDALHQGLFNIDFSVLYDEQMNKKNIFFRRDDKALDSELEMQVLRQLNKLLKLQDDKGLLIFKVSEKVHVYTVSTNNGIEVHIGSFVSEIDKKYEGLLILKEKERIITRYLTQENMIDDTPFFIEKFQEAWSTISLIERLTSHIPDLHKIVQKKLTTVDLQSLEPGSDDVASFAISENYNGNIEFLLPKVLFNDSNTSWDSKVHVMVNNKTIKVLSLKDVFNSDNKISIRASEIIPNDHDQNMVMVFIQDDSLAKWDIMNKDAVLLDLGAKPASFNYPLPPIKLSPKKIFSKVESSVESLAADYQYIFMRYFTHDDNPLHGTTGDLLVAERLDKEQLGIVPEKQLTLDSSVDHCFSEMARKLVFMKQREVFYRLYGLGSWSKNVSVFKVITTRG